MTYLASLLLATALAGAPDELERPVVAPVGSWVAPTVIPPPSPDKKEEASQKLLTSVQLRPEQDNEELYFEAATLVQKRIALVSEGVIHLPWHAGQSDLVVHKIDIIRGDRVIDALGPGSDIMVSRMEGLFGSSLFDGRQVATLLLKDLRVGDIVNVAATVRTEPTAVPFRPETYLSFSSGDEHKALRIAWPAKTPVRWKVSPHFGKPSVRTKKGETELIIKSENDLAIAYISGAPRRYSLAPFVQISGYSSWQEAGSIVAPLFTTAATLRPDSALHAEIEKIARETSDQRQRAISALKLVQDEVRYVMIGLAHNGYVPDQADEVWAKRYGDCKGKSSLLLALLNGLGIKAEPLLVSTQIGDGVADRLPAIEIFDHVIVRAEIDGRSYFLDSTGWGDRDIETLASSKLGYGLPIRAGGADLIKLPQIPPHLPLEEIELVYDASKGFHHPIPWSGTVIYRGAAAIEHRESIDSLGKEAFAEVRKESFLATENKQIDELTVDDSAPSGDIKIAFRGVVEMPWHEEPDAKNLRYQLIDEVIEAQPDFSRDEGDESGAPFVMDFPHFKEMRQKVILPLHGAGFSITGQKLEKIVGGTLVFRGTEMKDGVVVSTTRLKHLTPEISVDEAKATEAIWKEIAADNAFIDAPTGYAMLPDEAPLRLAAEPMSADGYIDRGYIHLREGSLDSAAADFDSAIAASPESSRPRAAKALVLAQQGKYTDAAAALRDAEALDEDDFVIDQGYGLLYANTNRPRDSVLAFTKALLHDEHDTFSLISRAFSHAQLGEYDLMQADFQKASEISPEDPVNYRYLSWLQGWRGEHDAALATTEGALRLAPEDPMNWVHKGALLKRLGHAEDARQSYEKALSLIGEGPQRKEWDDLAWEARIGLGQYKQAIEDTSAALKAAPDDPMLLNTRCWTRVIANMELNQALADCEKAVSLAPDRADLLDSRGVTKLRLGQLNEAIADFDAAIVLNPNLAPSYHVRALAKLKLGDRAGAEADMKEARRLMYDVAETYAEYGLTP